MDAARATKWRGYRAASWTGEGDRGGRTIAGLVCIRHPCGEASRLNDRPPVTAWVDFQESFTTMGNRKRKKVNIEFTK